MSISSKLSRIDKNRYAKIYPILHRTPRFSYQSDGKSSMEFGEICFSNNDTIVYSFLNSYLTVPNVIITPYGDDINVWIESISLSNVTFRSSINNSSCVSFQVTGV